MRPRVAPTLLGFAAPLLATAVIAAQSPPISVRVYPERPLIERDEHQQYLNFDFGLANASDSAITVERVEMSVFDRRDRLIRRQFIWSKGAANPGFTTVTDRTIPAGGSLGLFNPFYALPPSLEVHRLHFEFIFGTRGLEPTSAVGVDVRPVRYAPAVRLILPVDGPAIVYDGHDFYSHHRRIPLGSALARSAGFDANPVRYANDFTPVGPGGELTRGPAADPTAWYAYGAVVRAPAGGEVVSAVTDVDDNRVENGELAYPAGLALDEFRSSVGNHVVIKHPGGVFSVLAHLKKGSVRVTAGQRVTQGDPVGAIGFSGDTGFHVHVHHMLVTAFSIKAESVPAYFDRVRRVALPRAPNAVGGPVLSGARVDTGDLIESVRP
jgi:Peptidase family M23